MGKRLLATAMVIGLLGLTGGTALAEAESVDRKEVQQALDKLTHGGGALGAQARVTNGRDRVLARSGVAKLDTDEPVPLNGRFRVGSITKTFVSVVLLQLNAEGKLDLDAPVDKYLPGLIDKTITVRQVLQHTSGLYDYTRALPLNDFESIRFKHWEPNELLKLSTSQPLDFPPGTKWSYSNSNYIVAGLLVEKLTGRPYEQAVQRRILTPLRLNETVVPGDRSGIPGPHAHGYYTVKDKPVDVTRMNPSVAWAAGEMISTTGDLDTYVTALAKGKLLKKAQLDEMTKTTAVSPDYGLGLGITKLPCGVTVWGHGGGIFGYLTEMMTTPDASKRLEASLSTAPTPGNNDGYEDLIKAAFC
ncbi:serine hydrolase [Lentzea sp. NBRC 105346]|uniref:serine hydrolase domain-containing protein n=1 Tax=Lentzea sp. NBRC 105346 TaxID=3032205 RepID=UPI0024A3AFDC|nr:serine hydrolase domain-containing protein [Lentzea sp. NBRC 105346]GLZ29998.1 serine hydrolase [Lentzea sp. NBRC 105346]